MYIGSLGTVANTEDWQQAVELINRDNDVPVDLTGASIVFSITAPGEHRPTLTASTAAGTVDIADPPQQFVARFTAEQLGRLCSGTHGVRCDVFVQNVNTRLIRGTVSITNGIIQ